MRAQWMSSSKATPKGGPRARAGAASAPPDIPRRATASAAALALAVALLVVLPLPQASAAPNNTLDVQVQSARTESRAAGGGVHEGDPVTSYKFLINEDNTGSTTQRTPTGACSASAPNYPANCNWPSIRELPHTTAPIVAQGTDADLADGLDLPDGKYLISVLADGYKLDGAHFTVPFTTTAPVIVEVQPDPLPDATFRAQVYQDEATTNGAIDNSEQGLAGFQGHLNDTLGEVTTDVYGNPLCTTYVGEKADDFTIPAGSLDSDGAPVVDKVGGKCFSDSTGMLAIPHLGSNRYTATAQPPDGQDWIQTTTLEGNHDFDTWLMEGATGYDTEATVAGEPVPTPQFGFAKPKNTLGSGASGSISGVVVGVKQYTPPKGGDANFFNGLTGSKTDKPIPNPVLSLADLQNGDQAVWVGRGKADGSFSIPNVPDGDYTLSWWDEPQNYILTLVNVTVRSGEAVKMGQLPLNGWWTPLDGYVFNDTNRNGKKDSGETGIPNFTLTLRKQDNSLMDRGTTTAVTDATGYYSFEGAYPLAAWTVMEAYNDSFFSTGVTYQADNQKTPTTVKGSGVDVSTLNMIGLSGTMDWGVHAYDPTGKNGIDPRNGGIVGSLSYDTTRNELDPRYAAAEDWQPGISDLPVELHAPVDCPADNSKPCDEDGYYQLAPDGSYAKGTLLNTYVSEHWTRPTGCTARDVDGKPLVHKTDNPANFDEDVLAPNQETDGECISAILQSVQYGPGATDQGTADANFGESVDGNYGFGDGCLHGTLDATDPANPTCTDANGNDAFEALGSGDYLVSVDIPDDQVTHRPLYNVTGEEDINIAHGDQIIPQVPPPACAGALHTVDVADDGTDNYPALDGDGTNGAPTGVTVAASSPVDNPSFVKDVGGSPYEGQVKPKCDTKLVSLNNGKSIVPMFNLFTDVPIPSRLFGLVVDDINYGTDPRSTLYGEKPGLPFAPVGLYDFNNRLVQTLESDFNGYYETLMPSSDKISCPTPSGVCTGMYRFVGNDPGIPGAVNANYNPRYRTIATEFEAMPGVTIPTDLAPTQVGSILASPTTGLNVAVSCPVDAVVPQLFAVSKPYVNGSGSFTIEGTGFGATKGTGKVTLDGTALTTTGWTNTTIQVTVPAGTATGAHALKITADNGKETVNGLTFHVLGSGYNPTVREVGPGKQYAKIQAALDAAYSNNGAAGNLVVVYPGNATAGTPNTNTGGNPRGEYFENLVMASPVKLQGVGSGGFQGNTYVPGTVLNASGFAGDTDLATAWYTKVGGLTWDGNQNVSDGEAIYLLASSGNGTGGGQARNFGGSFHAAVDGFDIQGGDQQGFPGNINSLNGLPTGLPANITTQGGAIFANAYVKNLQITNNVVENNGGGYGAVRIGTPDLAGSDANQHNEGVRIADNRLISNAGTNLAGAVGLFGGSDGYEVSGNDICGNFSLEYGAGVSVYGSSPGGKIHHNRIYFNNSNDEGAGIMIAGALPANPNALSPGTGAVDIYNNLIQGNLSNDDGGGIRFLMSGNYPMNVTNNTIVNNVSTHEGAGVAINDAPNVRLVNNTIMKNTTTATAVTSDGTPAPAGIATSLNSDQLQATLPNGSKAYSDPVLFNNILWDNRAGTRAGTTVTGIGLAGDTSAVEHWDLGLFDTNDQLAPTSSVVQQDVGQHPYATNASNSTANPGVVSTYDTSVAFATWRQNPAFVDATLVAAEAPANQLGDYHLAGTAPNCTSPACNLGAATKGSVNAPATDIDDEVRPALGGFDAGSDEFGSSKTGTTPPPATKDFFFSTAGLSGSPIPGLAGDVLRYTGSFSRHKAQVADLGLPLFGVNIDGLSMVDNNHFYVSFDSNLTIARPGPDLAVADEDVAEFNNGTWSTYFDASARGLSTGIDLDAISVVNGVLYFSVNSTTALRTGLSGDVNDIYAWTGGNNVNRVVTVAGSANMDSLVYTDATHFLASYSVDTTLTGAGAVQDEDIVEFSAGTWSVWFDGTAAGLTSNNQDIDAFSLPGATVTPPPPPPPPGPTGNGNGPVVFSTLGNTNPLNGTTPVAGTADDADLYSFNGSTTTRQLDVTALPVGSNLLASANMDAYDRVDATHFYASFADNTWVPGPGVVQDEDVVYYNNGVWSVWFDGTSRGLTSAAQDIDAISVSGNTLYFSTAGNTNPPRTTGGGTADDSDIYSVNRTAAASTAPFTRVWDATANGVPSAANVDGYVRVDATHFYLSFRPDTTLPGLGAVQDEDVVFNNGGTWSNYFDGTAHGLTAAAADVDAFDIP